MEKSQVARILAELYDAPAEVAVSIMGVLLNESESSREVVTTSYEGTRLMLKYAALFLAAGSSTVGPSIKSLMATIRELEEACYTTPT